ncbi:reverse transcriptase domain-containing protein [Tanacetum coccineum]
MGWKPFNTEHKLPEYKYIKPVNQKKRRLGLDRSKTACKEVEELTKAGILWKVKNQTWVANPVMVKKSDRDAEEAFQKMKKFMEILPTLTAPIKGEVLVMYLTALTESISAVLLARREEREFLIYFVSRVLQGAELNYPALDKLILALLHAARRLRRERSSAKKHITKDFSVEMPSDMKRIFKKRTTRKPKANNSKHGVEKGQNQKSDKARKYNLRG